MLDSLKVVRDFFRLEAFLRDGDQNNSDTPSTVAGLRQPHPSGNSSNSMSSNLPASPLQTILAFAGLSAGEGPQLSDLLPFCEVLDNALAQTATLSNDANSSFVPVETHPCGQFHQPREGTPEQAEEERLAGRATTAAGAVGRTGGPSCLMEEALVCLDTDGSGSVEFDEFLAASMTRLDFLERKPTCRYLICTHPHTGDRNALCCFFLGAEHETAFSCLSACVLTDIYCPVGLS